MSTATKPRNRLGKFVKPSKDYPCKGVVRLAPSGMPPARRSKVSAYEARLEGDEEKFEKLAAKHLDVMRAHAYEKAVTGGGNHLPCMIVKKHGKGYGPCSKRQSKGKSKKSGSARGNLCHQAGVNPNIGRESEARRMHGAYENLRRWHTRMWGSHRSYSRNYLGQRARVIAEWPRLEAKIKAMELEHERTLR